MLLKNSSQHISRLHSLKRECVNRNVTEGVKRRQTGQSHSCNLPAGCGDHVYRNSTEN